MILASIQILHVACSDVYLPFGKILLYENTSAIVMFVVVARPLPRDRVVAEDHGAPGRGPEIAERQAVAKERVSQRVRSWTAQNESRCGLGLMIVDAA